MSGLLDVLSSGRVPDVFEQVVGLRLFGISASFSRHTSFRVFVGLHDFPCFCQFTRLSVSHGFPCLRVFGVTRVSVSHGFPCLRVFALPRSSNYMFVVWSAFGRPCTCYSVRSLRDFDPSGRHRPFSASLLSRRWRILCVLPVRLGHG
jgi:hypothetical protein